MTTAYLERPVIRLPRVRAADGKIRLSAKQLVMPLFVQAGKRTRAPIASMPGQFRLSIDQAALECRELAELGVPAVLLFGVADRKDERASRAYATDGIVQQAVAAIKREAPHMLVITDVCVCAYTTHGHCGILKASARSRAGGGVAIDNNVSVALLAQVALSHAQAGADVVAPSDKMNGTVGAIRRTLDGAGFGQVPILAYAAKFASSFYGPFRDAVDCAPQFGDRRGYQLDPADADEAVRAAARDVAQGAAMVMVKPALAYLDVIHRIKRTLRVPVAAFNVSGEYAMVRAAAARGWLSEQAVWLEMLLAMKRAGADILITYWAREAAKLLRQK
jgi:porphobilinogen synthase